MSRAWLPLLLGPLGTGCIIYEDRYHSPNPCEGCGVPTPTDTDTDTEPTLTDAVALTVDEGHPGESFLSTLVPVTAELDLTMVDSVTFERDVAVLDMVQSADQIVLLLEVAADAAPGDVFVQVSANGNPWRLAEPFHVLPAADTAADTGSAVDSGATDTGSSDTGDTGSSR
ncbi:MAG: hypothetical protein ABMA64_21725 [Myxococcota bacterium]